MQRPRHMSRGHAYGAVLRLLHAAHVFLQACLGPPPFPQARRHRPPAGQF